MKNTATKKISNAIMISVAFLWWSYALAMSEEQRAHEDALTQIAIERCSSEQIEGKDYSIKVLGDGNLEVSFFGKKGGEVKGSFVFTKNQWEGRQRVLPGDQAVETESFRKCKQEELKFLKDSYRPPASQSDVRRLQIEKCVAEKVANFEIPQQKNINGGARSPSRTGSEIPRSIVPVCLSVGPNQTIISADTANTCCHGDRCSVTAPDYSDGHRKVCVTTECWSDNKLFGGGGCGKYTLTINYKNVADDAIKKTFWTECELAER